MLYALLLDEGLMRGKQRPGVRVFLHNLGVAGIMVQLVTVYLNTFVWKLMGPANPWLDGTLLYYVMHQGGASLAWARPLFELPLVTRAATYLTLAYQLAFVLLLPTRWHPASVVVGVGFHVGIALVLGLVPFGLIMTGLVLLTVKDEGYAVGKARALQLLLLKRSEPRAAKPGSVR